MEMPVLVWSLKSSILSSTSFQMGKTFWGVVSAAVEQSRRKANMVAQGDGKFGPWGWPQGPSNPPQKSSNNVTTGTVLQTHYFPLAFRCHPLHPLQRHHVPPRQLSPPVLPRPGHCHSPTMAAQHEVSGRNSNRRTVCRTQRLSLQKYE